MMLVTVLKTNRWIQAAALVLILSVGIIIYDTLRTPEYARRLEESGYPINIATLETINPPVNESQNANTLLYKAYLMQNFPFDILKEGKQHLPREFFGEHVSCALPVKLGDPYPIEQQRTLKILVDANRKALKLIHQASRYPKFFPDMEVNIYYSSFSSLVAEEGFDALLSNNLMTFNKDINTLFRLLRLLQQPDDLSVSADVSYIKRINLLIENALNRTSLSKEILEPWTQELKQAGWTDTHKLINAIVYSGIDNILENANHTHTFLANNWNALRLYLDLTDTWDNISKIVFPRMGDDLYQLIQKKKSTSTLQLLEEYQDKLHVLQSSFPPKYITNISVYEPLPRPYRYSFRGLRYTSTISSIKSYLAPSAHSSIAQTGIALYLYGQDHGTFPETLEALVPEYLDTVPVNPFTEDEPIHYRQEEDRVVVYSEDKEISFTLLKKILNITTEQL